MKILNLKIISPGNEIIQDIDFKESGVSIILADIKKKEDAKKTVNSIGKTLLLKMIDYLYGANNDKGYFKAELDNYMVEGTLKKDNMLYKCTRSLGDSSKNTINNVEYTLKAYKNFFSIKRNFLDKQVFFEEKNSLISSRQKPSCDDYLSFLTLLKLDDVGELAGEIYKKQDLIGELKKEEKNFMDSHNMEESSELEEEIFLVDKRVDEYEEELKNITAKIEKIQIHDLKEDVFEQYTEESTRHKNIKRNIELTKIEQTRLKRFIEDSNKIDVKSEDVMAIFQQAKIEIPDMVKREINEVQRFHEKVYLERREHLLTKIAELEEACNKLEIELEDVGARVDSLGSLISEDKVYKEAILYYEKFTGELSELKFKQGQLSRLKDIQKSIAENKSILTKQFEDAKLLLDSKKDVINTYTNFIYEFVKLIYTNDVTAFFDISIKDMHLAHRPVKVELNLRGDTGEGVGNVRNLLIDYLIFRYNDVLEILIQDSACYNGIDPRQVASMIKELNTLANENNKQAILSLNKYQFLLDNGSEDFLEENASLILSEEKNLLGFIF